MRPLPIPIEYGLDFSAYLIQVVSLGAEARVVVTVVRQHSCRRERPLHSKVEHHISELAARRCDARKDPHFVEHLVCGLGDLNGCAGVVGDASDVVVPLRPPAILSLHHRHARPWPGAGPKPGW